MSLPAVSHVAVARPPRGEVTAAPSRAADRIAPLLHDAAHVPGGHADAVAFPRSEADVAALLRGAARVLPIGAQSSLTGGATPMGGLVLAMTRMTAVAVAGDRVVAESGATLTSLQEQLAADGAWYPPVPTFLGATIGGVIATNAAGAATFKYGTTRDWVEAMTVVLPSGDVLDLRRGAVVADGHGAIEVQLADRRVRLAMPSYRLPPVAKISAGYFAAPGMDLIDLFIGAEGTLGVITSATLRVVRPRPAVALALITCPSRDSGLRVASRLRADARQTWRTPTPGGVDVAAIEHMDARSLALLREDGADRTYAVALPADSAMALLVAIELPAGTPAAAFDAIARALDADAPDAPLVRLCRLLDEEGLLERTEIALPGDRRQAALLAIREAVPAAVNRRIALAQQAIDPAIEKMAADVIVPFASLPVLLDRIEHECRGLDVAVWGHISDGNLHPNVIPHRAADLAAGKAAMLALGRAAIALGGAPCAEHGVGRNPIKQQLIRELHGDEGVAAMRAIKRTLDPDGRLAPGVLGLTSG